MTQTALWGTRCAVLALRRLTLVSEQDVAVHASLLDHQRHPDSSFRCSPSWSESSYPQLLPNPTQGALQTRSRGGATLPAPSCGLSYLNDKVYVQALRG